jgi:hypothetical protein
MTVLLNMPPSCKLVAQGVRCWDPPAERKTGYPAARTIGSVTEGELRVVVWD